MPREEYQITTCDYCGATTDDVPRNERATLMGSWSGNWTNYYFCNLGHLRLWLREVL